MIKKFIFIVSCLLVLLVGHFTGYLEYVISHPKQNIVEVLVVILTFGFIWVHSTYKQDKKAVIAHEGPKPNDLKQLVFGIPNQETGLYVDCAILCANIYLPPENDYLPFVQEPEKNDSQRMAINGWKIINNHGIKQIKNPGDSKLAIELWRHQANRIIAVVFRGTVRGFNSWYANFNWVTRYFAFKRNQYEEVRDLTTELSSYLKKSVNAGYEVISTGHSLGGGLAQHINYMMAEISRTYVFNTSPVTGWYDVREDIRTPNVQNSRIYRLYERSEILQYLRIFIKFGYLFNPKPNIAPYMVEHRLNLTNYGLIKSHSIRSLAYGLNEIRKDK